MDVMSRLMSYAVMCLGPFLICLAMGLIGYISYVGFGTLLPIKADPFTLSWFFYVFVGMYLIVNVIFNYFMCVTTNPGTPTSAVYKKLVDEAREKGLLPKRTTVSGGALSSDEADDEAEESEGDEIGEDGGSSALLKSNKKMVGTRRQQRVVRVKAKKVSWMDLGPFEWTFCRHSGEPKPPRAHYCHVSRCLVLNMDHYCPWMFNCVGFCNYRYFVLFLLHVWAGTFFVALCALSEMQHVKSDRVTFSREVDRQITFLFVLGLSVGLAVSILLFWHIYLLLTAQTTIEFYGNFTRKQRAQRRGEVWSNPYDVGLWGNWVHLFGPGNIFLALLPSSRPPPEMPWSVAAAKRVRQRLRRVERIV
eukprot:g983.t1